MVPILGAVVAVVLADRDNLLRSAGLVVAGAAAVIAIGWLIGLAVQTPVVAATNSQVAAVGADLVMGSSSVTRYQQSGAAVDEYH